MSKTESRIKTSQTGQVRDDKIPTSMVNPKANLVPNILDLKSIDQKPIREGFGVGLVEAADADSNVVGVCADLTESSKMEAFAKIFPERFVLPESMM